jgi:ParB family transcriptional regulator, chromosome partitioning protein
VTEKLQAEAERLKAEGWSWVEINRTEDGWQAARAYQQLRPKSVSLSEDLQAEADRLINERETSQPKDEDDYSEEDEDRLEAINRRLEIIEATRYVFTPKQKSLSGVMIGITAADYGLTQKTCLKGYRRVGRCAVC